MMPTITRGATRVFGEPKNWNAAADGECGDLQVRVEEYGESRLPQLVSTWKPTPAELDLLKAGGVVEVMLITSGQPPMAVSVVRPVAPALTKYLSQEGTDGS